MAEFFGDQLGGIGINHVGDLDHLALFHQETDHVYRAFGHTVGQFLDGDGFRNDDLAGNLFFRLVGLVAFQTLHAAAESGQRTGAFLVTATGCGGHGQTATAAVIGATGTLGLGSHSRSDHATGTAHRTGFFFLVIA